ncbi:xanthosine phosphorylase [Massilia sp. P8910]|uniref:Purine nucleoside phosphorylase n=2 Tax=Massilia TaxID=149698 RepID=A0A2D2DHU9_9BURK|nr:MULTISPECIES: xanthosine phosphorylase [Massilia]CUI07615.1 Xanthosine phosphorylase [Janthinobacterium sp. CG23_2]ATQ74525.1 xanthosine phosphorylase [Massilia violaceinigra]MCE3607405.1 xanthosine phosphorylase [Massilia antarctica]MCY0913033.1 xanthosine phosphorylase [Massilia sp. H27-R4]QPI52550.1 xanthosine phosphorylase [Massilia antarctica]
MSNNTPFEAADIIRARKPGFEPRVAMILGSGLGVLAEQMTDAVSIGFDELPGFPISTVHGHAGELVLGTLAGVNVVCMKGRGHFYEGYGMGVMTSAVRTMKLLGCEMLFVTNAAGSLRTEVDAGSLVALTDHINWLPGTPMVGPNDDRFGPRFFSMANAYDSDIRNVVKETAAAKGITLHEGVFIAYPGPNFETAAEIRMMAKLGADVVGMSVVPEVVSARHCGLKVVGVSVITNLAEGMSPFPLSHEQTLKYAAIGAKDLVALIPAFLERVAAQPRAAA